MSDENSPGNPDPPPANGRPQTPACAAPPPDAQTQLTTPPAAEPEFVDPLEARLGTIVELKAKDTERLFAIYPTREYVHRRSVRYRWPLLVTLAAVVLGCLVDYAVTRRTNTGTYVTTGLMWLLAAGFLAFIWNATMRAALQVTLGRTLNIKAATVRLVIDPRIGEKLALRRSPDGRLWHVCRTSHGYSALKFKLAVEAFPNLPDFFKEKTPDLFQELP